MAQAANAYERLGWCYFRLGHYDRSIDAYRSAIEIEPDHWPALNGAGINALNTWLLSGKNDHHRSEATFKALARALRAAVALDSRNPGALPSTQGGID